MRTWRSFVYGARQLAVLYAPSTTSTALIDAFLEHSALEHYPHYLPRTLLSVSSRKQSQLRVSSFPFVATKSGVSYVALSVAQASQTPTIRAFPSGAAAVTSWLQKYFRCLRSECKYLLRMEIPPRCGASATASDWISFSLCAAGAIHEIGMSHALISGILGIKETFLQLFRSDNRKGAVYRCFLWQSGVIVNGSPRARGFIERQTSSEI